MVNRIIIFIGSKRDFDKMLSKEIDEDNFVPFMEMIQYYNAKLRPTDSAYGDEQRIEKNIIENCVVRAEDYASVLEHAITNFVNIVTLNHNVENLFIHNPPKRVIMSLRSIYDNIIEYQYSMYQHIDRQKLKYVYKLLCQNIIGQNNPKKQIITNLYKLCNKDRKKPVVILLYGPSGVGKTETAKFVSYALDGELLRIQFSMMQTTETYNYIFGAEHSKSSFAKDLKGRESEVILIDEFDKVNGVFYNAFYEVFDEGHYVDTNYDVDLRKSIFICTSNFNNEDEIKLALGPAMYSRISCCIEYEELIKEEKNIIIEEWYKKCLEQLIDDEKEIILKSDVLDWFINNSERYDNIRILKTKMENAIYDLLVERFIIQEGV